MKELTSEQAIALGNSRFWETMNYEERAKFQIVQERLCMPFAVFHEAITKHLGRPVYTHEFDLNYKGLLKEVFDGGPPPTPDEIINLIPKEKLLLIGLSGEGEAE